MLAPENVQAMLICSLGALKMVERVFAGKHGAKARQIVRQAHRRALVSLRRFVASIILRLAAEG